jgi:hypothetical protein
MKLVEFLGMNSPVFPWRSSRNLSVLSGQEFLKFEKHKNVFDFLFFLLRKTKSYGIFKHPRKKGRPNLSEFTHKSLSELTRPIVGQVSFRASSDRAN